MICCLNPNCQQPLNPDRHLYCQSCGTPLVKLLRNRYKIIEPLGRGGFGKTYKAEDPDKLNELCIVKQLAYQGQETWANQKAEELFEQEAKRLQQLSGHPQIPALLAYFQEGNYLYLVQQFIAGRDLLQELQQTGTFSQEQIRALLLDLLPVLKFISDRGVIHRDIKPANIMRPSPQAGEKGALVLIDFGIAKLLTATIISQGATALGSPGFAPPEQLHGGRVTAASDLFGVGATCFQLLSGSNPFILWTESNYKWVNNWREYLPNSLSPELDGILDKLLQLDITRRFQSADEVLQQLQTVKRGWWQRLFGQPSPLPSNISLPLPQPPRLPNPPLPTTHSPVQTATSLVLDEPEGLVELNSNFYVERPPIEIDCCETIVKPGSLIRIKAPRQMGKTSLMVRILDRASQECYRSIWLNLQSADAEFLSSLDRFLQWFCASVTNELNLPERVGEFWQGVLGSKNKCTNYFQRYLLTEITSPLALGLDEIDQLFQYPEIATDFFGLLRAWHEKAKNEPVWKNLRLVIVHSKEVYIPLNINQSPFNVGLPIELPELDRQQVQDLVNRHQLDWNEQQIEAAIAMFGGHPYLIRVALYHIAKGRTTLEQLLQVAPTEEGLYYDHLRRHLLNLEKDPQLVNAIDRVVTSSDPVQIGTAEAFKLRSMGLVKFKGNAVTPLCDMYRQYFRDRLGNK